MNSVAATANNLHFERVIEPTIRAREIDELRARIRQLPNRVGAVIEFYLNDLAADIGSPMYQKYQRRLDLLVGQTEQVLAERPPGSD